MGDHPNRADDTTHLQGRTAVKNLNLAKDLCGEIGLLVTPENLAAWDRVLSSMSADDRSELEGLIAEMKQRSRAIRELAPRLLARSA